MACTAVCLLMVTHRAHPIPGGRLDTAIKCPTHCSIDSRIKKETLSAKYRNHRCFLKLCKVCVGKLHTVSLNTEIFILMTYVNLTEAPRIQVLTFFQENYGMRSRLLMIHLLFLCYITAKKPCLQFVCVGVSSSSLSHHGEQWASTRGLRGQSIQPLCATHFTSSFGGLLVL